MPDDKVIVHWTWPMMKRFELAYEKAVEQNKDTFMFDEHEFFTPYAKYLLEHLKKQLTNTNDN